MLDMSDSYALFIKKNLVAIFTDYRECLVWCSEHYPGKEVLVKRVRRIGNMFSIFEIPIRKIELRDD
jgi:hypothetical protein